MISEILLFLSIVVEIFGATKVFKAEDVLHQPASEERILLQDKEYWFNMATRHLRNTLIYDTIPKQHVAKNIIVFVGDGMGISTITAARIYKGQRKFNKMGEEHNLVYENFPNVALVKTYNVDMQIPDSAGTATALFTGIKTRYEMVGLDVTSQRNSFEKDIFEKSKVESIMTWAQEVGKDTGIVTTTRVSHATPACTYAHVSNRYWECDSKIPEEFRNQTKDISSQLIQDTPGKNFKVILGGGTQLLGHISTDEGAECSRLDGQNLTQMWVDQHKNSKYVLATDNNGLDQVTDDTEYLFGVFAPDNLPYESFRDKGPKGSPSLTEMTKKALQVLKKNDNGFVLMVEGGRIDHAHHKNYARIAMEESSEFDNAIKLAVRESGPDTLIIVTADHSHTLTMNGYSKRGSDILGYSNKKDDTKPMLTLGYGNGPGFTYHYNPENSTNVTFPWIDVKTDSNLLTDKKYQHIGSYYLTDETHGGEDVAVYSNGPGSHLLRGVIEQHYIAHVISYAGCFGPQASSNIHCSNSAILKSIPNFGFLVIGLNLIVLLFK